MQFKSRLADETDDAYFMEPPVADHIDEPYIPRQGHTWRVSYSPIGSALFSFDTVVLDVVHNNVSYVQLKRPALTDVEKIQRREFLRMPLNLDVTLEADDGSYHLHGVTLDVSGGGISISCHAETPAQQGDCLSGTLSLPAEDHRASGTEIPISIELLRVERPADQEKRLICYSRFTSIKAKDRAAIIRLCNKRQRELYLKGLAD